MKLKYIPLIIILPAVIWVWLFSLFEVGADIIYSQSDVESIWQGILAILSILILSWFVFIKAPALNGLVILIGALLILASIGFEVSSQKLILIVGVSGVIVGLMSQFVMAVSIMRAKFKLISILSLLAVFFSIPILAMPFLGFAPSVIYVGSSLPKLKLLDTLTFGKYLNVPQRTEYISRTRYRPIIVACKFGKIENVEYLINKGYSPDTKTGAKSCLTSAIINRDVSLVSFLTNSVNISAFSTSSLKHALEVALVQMSQDKNCVEEIIHPIADALSNRGVRLKSFESTCKVINQESK